MEKPNYYIGLDMGTDSVGWAVTDEKYNILKSHGKAMWGIHLFDSGKTAEERRMFRTARRKTDRDTQRIELLNELFAEEITKVDPNFLIRLQESKYFLEDKAIADKYTLFNDETYTDIQYHKDYPTIYHLRSELVHNADKHDIRMIYLAISHIIKKRGHFLFEGQEIGAAISFSVVFDELKQVLSDYEIEFSVEDPETIKTLIMNKKITVNDKKRELKNLFSASSNETKAVCDLLAGGTVELSNLFGDDSLKDAEISKITFKSGYEDKTDQLESILGEDFYLVEKIKAVYDWGILADILKSHKYISDAKIDAYDKHKHDLKLVKSLVKKYAPDDYKKIFSDNKVGNNYVSYVGNPSGVGKYMESKSCSQEDLCKTIMNAIGNVTPANDDEAYIIAELNNNTALPKQVTKDNGVIPYQLNLAELRAILGNASKYFDFLNKVEDGKTVAEKIEFILTFKIPYYVGPLNDHSENAWIVRKDSGKIYPWNFDEKVDKTASATNFIERMTNQCTYLVGETVLPKESIIFAKYAIYNHLNNIRIDGQKLPIEVKNKLFKDCYLNVGKPKKMTAKGILSYLCTVGYCTKENGKAKEEITGIDTDISITMKAYVNLKNVIGDRVNDSDMIEDIIYKITVLGESKDLLKKYITDTYRDKLSEDEIKQILRLKFTGWGSLSETFLTGIYHVDKATGECMSIITALENTQDNLMQLISNDNYDFYQKIQDFNADRNGIITNITYNEIEKLYVSPAVKRSIWRTSLIVKEIIKIRGYEPKKIFIEMARDNTNDNKGRRSVSRRNQLLDCYNESKKDCATLAESLEKYDDNQLRSDKLFLYYTQMGRCMYCGKPIDLDNLLSNNSRYDIDHIYPQSKTKDDSLDNRVLVEKTHNAEKSDKYPLPQPFRTNETVALWKRLLDLKLISKEKYNRLMRTEGFSAEELSRFIARQIVETRQSTKAAAKLFERVYKDTKIVYVKAGNVSNFRQQYDIVKCRSVNDYHHAKDAYLNIVVGNVYDTKFGMDIVKFIKDGQVYSLNRMYDFNVERNGNRAWTADNAESLTLVKKYVMKNNILFTRYATEQKGGFFDQMPVKHGGGQMPLKTSDERMSNFDRYGGYNKVSGAYFALVRHIEKGKSIKTIESVPIYMSKQIAQNPAKLQEYFDSKFKDVEVLIPKIKINTLFSVDGFKMHLSGRTSNQLLFKCAEQLVLLQDIYEYFKKIDKYVDRNKQYRTKLEISPLQNITKDENLRIYDAFLEKINNSVYSKRLSSQKEVFKNGRGKFIEMSLESQCEFLSKAIPLFQCTPVAADLKQIGGAASAGILVLNSKVDGIDIKIINQSVTGIFENTLNLSSL